MTCSPLTSLELAARSSDLDRNRSALLLIKPYSGPKHARHFESRERRFAIAGPKAKAHHTNGGRAEWDTGDSLIEYSTHIGQMGSPVHHLHIQGQTYLDIYTHNSDQECKLRSMFIS